jgi:hypothetical protein
MNMNFEAMSTSELTNLVGTLSNILHEKLAEEEFDLEDDFEFEELLKRAEKIFLEKSFSLKVPISINLRINPTEEHLRLDIYSEIYDKETFGNVWFSSMDNFSDWLAKELAHREEENSFENQELNAFHKEFKQHFDPILKEWKSILEDAKVFAEKRNVSYPMIVNMLLKRFEDY